MASIAGIRQQYPQYQDMSDDALASALHGKFYSDMPRAEFDKKIGLSAQPQAVDPGIDVLKSTGVGAAEGVIGLADIPELGARGIHAATNFVERKLGFPESPRPGTAATSFEDRWSPLSGAQERQTLTGMELPSAANIQSKIEGATGKFYQPQTYAGEWAKTIGGFLPAAVGGPGGLAQRIGTQAVLPALASEGAGHATRGTAIEGPSRVAAALLAGPAASRIAAGRAAPTAEQLKDAYKGVINDPALRATPVSVGGLPGAIKSKLHGEGFDPLNTPAAFARADHIASYPAPTAGDLINVRKKMSADAQSKVTSNPAETAASGIAKREVDSFLNTVSPAFRDANANYAAAKRSDIIQGKAQQAENRAGAANSGQNVANTLRQRMVDILNSDKLRRGFSKEELAQMERVSRGTKTGNTARYIGNLLGGGGGLGQFVTAGALGGGGYYAGGESGLAAGLALAGLGRVGKSVERTSVRRQLANLDNMVRSRAPLAQVSRMPPATQDQIIRALLRSSAANPPPQANR